MNDRVNIWPKNAGKSIMCFKKLPKNDDRVEKCRLVAKTWPHPPWCSSSSFHQDRDDKQLHRIGYFLFRSFKDKLSSKSHIHNHLHHHHMRPTTRSHLSSLDHQRAPFRARAAGNTASIHVRPVGTFPFTSSTLSLFNSPSFILIWTSQSRR